MDIELEHEWEIQEKIPAENSISGMSYWTVLQPPFTSAFNGRDMAHERFKEVKEQKGRGPVRLVHVTRTVVAK